MTTYFTFNPYGITITGDYTPSTYGNICNFKNLSWFLGELSPDYLAEKFNIERKFNAEYAREFLGECFYNAKGGDAEDDLLNAIEEGLLENEHYFLNLLEDKFPQELVDLRYPRDQYEVQVLSELQKQFVKAYQEL